MNLKPLTLVGTFVAVGAFSASAADDGYSTPEGRARVAAYYTAFLQATTSNATPSPCPIEGMDVQALGRLNKWIDDRASAAIQQVHRSDTRDARRLLAGNDFVFGKPAIRREICNDLRWEAERYGLFPRAD